MITLEELAEVQRVQKETGCIDFFHSEHFSSRVTDKAESSCAPAPSARW